MKNILKGIFGFVFFSVMTFSSAQPLMSSSDSNQRQGYEAFRNEDWVSATMFLKKVVAVPGNRTDENYLMLIKSEIYSGEYKIAQQDCEKFLSDFPFSIYSAYIQYQNGRMLHLLGKNEDAIMVLSDFCHQHYDDQLYPMAIYWIAEAFYDEYNFDSAKGLYKRIVADFPQCERVMDAQYKLDLIEQRSREEKLLYLLKVIGEENLSTREEYERQIRIYEMEDKLGLNKEIIEYQLRIEELEKQLAEGKTAETSAVPVYTEVEPAPQKTVPVYVPSGNGGGVPSYAGGNGGGSGAGSGSGASAGSGSAGGAPAITAGTGSVQIVNEPSLHLKKKAGTSSSSGSLGSKAGSSLNNDVENLKKKAKQLQYMLEDQSGNGEK